jgi:hypothetical protein
MDVSRREAALHHHGIARKRNMPDRRQIALSRTDHRLECPDLANPPHEADASAQADDVSSPE